MAPSGTFNGGETEVANVTLQAELLASLSLPPPNDSSSSSSSSATAAATTRGRPMPSTPSLTSSRDVFALHRCGPGVPEEAELVDAFFTCQHNFQRNMAFVDVPHRRAGALRCPPDGTSHSSNASGEALVARGAVVQHAWHTGSEWRWTFLTDAVALQKAVSLALQQALAATPTS